MLNTRLSEISPPLQTGRLNECAKYVLHLEVVHEQLLQTMAEMAAVTRETKPDRERLTLARLRIAKASRARLELWEQVRQHLFPRVGQEAREILSRLAAENTQLREAASAIIATWSSAAIDRDWSGYCEAAKQIRWKQMSIVRHERRDLVPILQQLSRDRYAD